jgi:hypothetical protein
VTLQIALLTAATEAHLSATKRDINTAAENVNTPKAAENHAYVWYQNIKGALKSETEAVKLAVAMDVPLMTIFQEERILSTNLDTKKWSVLLRKSKDSMLKMVVVVNA